MRVRVRRLMHVEVWTRMHVHKVLIVIHYAHTSTQISPPLNNHAYLARRWLLAGYTVAAVLALLQDLQRVLLSYNIQTLAM